MEDEVWNILRRSGTLTNEDCDKLALNIDEYIKTRICSNCKYGGESYSKGLLYCYKGVSNTTLGNNLVLTGFSCSIFKQKVSD